MTLISLKNQLTAKQSALSECVRSIATQNVTARFYHELPVDMKDVYSDWLQLQNFNTQRQQLFSGGAVNTTEHQPALHTALRDPHTSVQVDGVNITNAIQATHRKITELVEGIYENGITDVIHIGMGGSVLGPALLYTALAAYRLQQAPSVHYVSHLDADVTQALLHRLDPKKTAVILVSKSFATEEVHYQAKFIKQWLVQAQVDSQQRIIAVTAEVAKAEQWGVAPTQIVPFGSWVGGRFSVWSAVSLSVVIAIGMENFQQFLAGAHGMDRHFLQTDIPDNLPLQLAILSCWHTEFCRRQQHAIIPYNAKLQGLPSYLQQLHMESLGKSCDIQGNPLQVSATPVIFGDIATRSQHALSQYFMQAPTFTPIDMIVIKHIEHDSDQRLLTHALAQSETLWQGYQDPQHPYKSIAAKHPHTLLYLDALSPFALGALLALYEHKIFTLGVLYGLNPFDQWGVERGKVIVQGYYQRLTS